jgi:nucleotide-binding universal stress UspA family protein
MAAYVRRAAALWGATVSLLHVCDLSSYSGFELYPRPGSEIAEDHWNIAKDKFEQFLLPEFPRESFPRILLAGDTASLIAETAKTNKFDLIAMPTHAGEFRRMMVAKKQKRKKMRAWPRSWVFYWRR